jgi:hypothetical protein
VNPTNVRMRVWREANESRCLMADGSPLPVYKDEVVMIVVGRSIEECARLLCPMLKPEGCE